jgi:hypothetical protein
MTTVSTFIKDEKIDYDFTKFKENNFSSQMGYLFESYVEQEVKRLMTGVMV